MKKILVVFLALLFVTACHKEAPFDVNDDQTVFQNIEFPDRPDFKPGEGSEKVILKSATIEGNLNTLTPKDLADKLIGVSPDAPAVSNVTFTGAGVAAGIFNETTNLFGFENGIVLSSGNINFIEGPNTSDGITGNNGLPGDADLNSLIPGYTTYDATVLEFDFECEYLQVISFQYVFASDEYNEYVGSAFNDVFGFFVNGVNIALIPETTIPVSINNLNCGNPYGSADNYCALFYNNDLQDGGGGYDTEMDGFTTVLTATAAVNPGLNHIKLAIADAGDRILDANVLIKAESFVCKPPVIPVDIDIKPGSDPNSINCNNANELITVAVLTTDNFDATQIDHETVEFEGAMESHINKKTYESRRHVEDVDLDGDLDLVLHFLLIESNLTCESVEGTLTGELFDGTPIEGMDAVRMVDVPQE